MPTRLTLTIPAPCHASWAAMTPAAQGHHCAACDKVVVDFTQKTDAEILALLRHTNQPCGRLTVNHRTRPLLPPAEPAPRWRTWMAATAAVLGLREATALVARAQYPVPIEQVITMGMVAAPYRVVQQLPAGMPLLVVRGRVTDKSSGDALPGVTVLVKGTTTGVSTEADGTFELQIPASAATNQTLVFSSVGFAHTERSLDFSAGQEVFVSLELDAHVLG